MPQLVKKRRSGWAVLAAGALIASLLAVGASPAAAQSSSNDPNHNPDFGANWSACVGEAGSHDEMFSDVDEDNVHADSINCIAYYGITVGKGDGSYASDEDVSAFQMRIFVQKAADLMGADGEAVLSSVTLSDTVTRLEMAQLMFGLVHDMDTSSDIVNGGDVRIHPRSGNIEFYDDDADTWVEVDDYFADAKAQVPIAESQLIGATYELGITRGTRGDGTLVSTSNSRFEPSKPVSRGQMASFITRTLDHSNLRARGLAIQRNTRLDTQVSYRDDDFAPIDDARIDVFSALYADDAFDADDGECEPNFVRDETPSHSKCAIDIGDQLTDEGNVDFRLVSDSDPITAACRTEGQDAVLRFETAEGSAGRTFWAWTGDINDEVDEDTILAELEDVARPVGASGPDYARVTGGLPTGDELAKMGETVTFTLQLYSQVGAEPNSDKDIAVGPDRSRNPYHLRVQNFFVASNENRDSDYGDGENEDKEGTASLATSLFSQAPGDWDYVDAAGINEVAAADATPFRTPSDSVVWPNSDGEYVITLSWLDLNAAPAIDNTDVGAYFTLTPFTQANDLIEANLLTELEAKGNYVNVLQEGTPVPTPLTTDVVTGHVIFSDDASDPHSVTGAAAGSYRTIAGSRTGNSVTVTVLDQYGDGMRNVQISVSSDLDVAEPGDDTPDEVTYPEEVDITVQDNEDGNDNGTAGEAEDDVRGTFKTRRNGARLIGYNYIGRTAKTEVITPESIVLLGDDPGTAETVEDDFVLRAQEVGGVVSVYWAKVGNNTQSDTTAAGEPESVPLLVPDVANRTIVANEPLAEADEDNPMAYYYDEDDTFIVAGVGATFEMFEEALSATLKDDGIYADTVMWENYVNYRPGRINRTIWELTLSCTAPAA